MRATNSVVTIACVVAAIGCGGSTEPGSGPDKRTISVTFCADYPPTWFAHQDEGGRWTRVPLVNASATFEGTEKQAFAMAEVQSGHSQLSVIYSTATSLEKLDCNEDTPSFGTKVVKGTATNLAGGYAFIDIGSGSGMGGYNGDTSFSVFGVGNGAQDLIATRKSAFDAIADKVIIRRALSYGNSDTIALDFGGSEAFATEIHAVTTTGAANAMTAVSHGFRNASVAHDFQFAANPTTLVWVPAAKLVAGDIHETSAFVEDANGMRVVFLKTAIPGPLTIPFGPVAAAPTVTSASTNPLRLRGELTAPAEYALGASMSWSQSSPSTSRSIEVVVLKDHTGSMPSTWALEMPDLRGTDGFQTSWYLTSASAEWGLQLYDGTIDGLLSLNAPGGEGMVRIASRSSMYQGIAPAPAPGSSLRGVPRILRPRLLARRN